MRFGKHYTGIEESKRRAIYEQRKRNILQNNEMFNQGIVKSRIEIDERTDWTDEELNAYSVRYPSQNDWWIQYVVKKNIYTG